MRLGRPTRAAFAVLAIFAAAGSARADNVVLKNGQRLNVTGYQLLGDKYRLQMTGGYVEVPFDDVARIEPEDTFAAPPPPVAIDKSHYRDLVEASALRYHVDADLISSVIATESNFNSKAVSRRNARGLMQLMPQTAAGLGVHDVFDPQQNIDAGTRYLGDLLARFRNDMGLALAAYNAGPERVRQYGRVPPFAGTTSYVRRVQKNYLTAKDPKKAAKAEPEEKLNVEELFPAMKTANIPAAPPASPAEAQTKP